VAAAFPAAATFGPMLLSLPEPYDFALSTGRYRAFGPDLANLWHEGGLHRVVGGREVRIESAPGGVDVEPLGDGVETVVRHFLGEPFELVAFYAFAGEDAVLADVVRRLRGLRPPLNPDPYETLVTSITAQQVSLRSAFAVRNRLIERFGVQAGHAWAFPTQDRLASASEDDLTALGFSRRKAEYVIGVARAEVDWEELRTLPDDEIKAQLVALRGLGEWTADWFLARHLARPRAWPAGDLGLVKAVGELYFDGVRPSVAAVRAFGERFAPFENLAAHYLLATLYTVAAAV
jgi:DNA-3-methyladenine glycosylase II